MRAGGLYTYARWCLGSKLEGEGTVGRWKEQAKEGRKGRGKVKVGIGRFTLGPGVLDVFVFVCEGTGGVTGW